MALRRFLLGGVVDSNPSYFGTFLIPDAGDGTGGEGGGTAVEDEEETHKGFSQAEVDKIVQDRLNKLNRELKKKEQAEKAQQAKLAELEAKIQVLSEPAPGTGEDIDAKTLQGKLEIQKQRFERDMAALNQKVTEYDKARQVAEERQRTVERDTELQQALISAGCLPDAIVAGMRYFTPALVLEDDRWMFTTKGNNILTIAEGVAEELPKYMKAPTMLGGGSGTGSSKDAKRIAVQNQLKEAEDKLKVAEQRVKTERASVSSLSKLDEQRQVVKQLRAALTNK